MHIQNFCPEAGKNFCGLPRQSFPSVAVMPHAAKVLKKVMVNTGEQKAGPRKTSKPRLPKLKR